MSHVLGDDIIKNCFGAVYMHLLCKYVKQITSLRLKNWKVLSYSRRWYYLFKGDHLTELR
jgi:hypothetical protein